MSSLVAAAAAWLVLVLPGAAGAAPPAGGATPPPDCAASGKACNDLYVVAHEDDDLLFMGPVLRKSISNKKHAVRTIYLTAGDVAEGSSTDRWSRREDGVRAAYADMAGVPDQWTVSTPAPGMHQYTLVKAPRVTLVFMRLYEAYGGDFLGRLWRGEIERISDIFGPSDGSGDNQTFTRQGLIDALKNEYVRFSAHRISTLDSSLTGWDQHADHIASALFALAANAGYAPNHTYVMYRDYNIRSAPRNVWGTDWVLKEHVFFDDYFSRDPASDNADVDAIRHGGEGEDYANWNHRQYTFQSVTARTRAIGGVADRCLVSDKLTAGAQLRLGACTETAQRWAITAGGQIQTQKGVCIGTPAGTDLVQLMSCTAVAGRNSFVMTNGQLRIGEAQCVGTGGLTDVGAAARAEDCQDLSTQRWWPQSDTPSTRTTTGVFGDGVLGDPAKWDSVALADVTGDGAADACARRSDGVWCAINNGSGNFGAATTWTSEYSDAAGWNEPQYGRTIQFGDISGDGRADLCGRSIYGVRCALANATGTAFEISRFWTSSFNDGEIYDDSPSYYLTFALADVNGDRFADACSRSDDGLRCAINTTTGDLGTAIRVSDEVSYDKGWGDEAFGSTVTFGDINGDGRADACGRGGASIVCATATWAPEGDQDFALPFATLANSSTDAFTIDNGWGDASKYRSIRIADVNGDGYGDVCGRDDAGVRCAIARPYFYCYMDPFRLVRRSFTADLWQTEAHGASLRFADVNKDGRADACWRSDTGLTCANT